MIRSSTKTFFCTSGSCLGWGVGSDGAGPNSGISGWGDRRQTPGWDGKGPPNGRSGHGGWEDGSNYKGGNNSNTWNNNMKEER